LYITNSLYRKYPTTQNYHYVSVLEDFIKEQKNVKETQSEEIE